MARTPNAQAAPVKPPTLHAVNVSQSVFTRLSLSGKFPPIVMTLLSHVLGDIVQALIDDGYIVLPGPTGPTDPAA